jgi:hypothetical protein
MRNAFCFVALAACSISTQDNFANPPPGPPATCAPIANLPGCDGGSLAYACTAGRPDDCPACGSGSAADQGPSLACDRGTSGVGATLYCCAPFGTYYSECKADPAIAGCGAPSIGFSCAGPTSPADADARLACSAPIANADGTTGYCCSSATVPATCAADPSVACVGVAIGYTCAGADAPDAGNATLACAITAASGGATSYCCAPASP